MSSSYPEQRFLSRTRAGGLTPPIDGLLTLPRALSASAQYTDNLSAYAQHKHDRQPMSTPHTVFWRCRDAHPATRTPPRGAHPIRHACLAKPHLAPASGANKTHTQRAYKTRPDQPVRARNVFGSGVRTLAVVRAVLTTIATLTTPLRHVILLGFVV